MNFMEKNPPSEYRDVLSTGTPALHFSNDIVDNLLRLHALDSFLNERKIIQSKALNATD